MVKPTNLSGIIEDSMADVAGMGRVPTSRWIHKAAMALNHHLEQVRLKPTAKA